MMSTPSASTAGSRRRRAAGIPALVALLSGCSLFHRQAPAPPPPTTAQVGVASWYGSEFQGSRTANGERFDPTELSAAHRTLPLGTHARITNLANGRSVVVRINDRGPYARGRVVDVSYGAARALGMVGRGTTRVRIEPLDGNGAPARDARARVARYHRRGATRR